MLPACRWRRGSVTGPLRSGRSASLLLLTQHPCAKSSAELLLRFGPGEARRDEATVFTGIEHRLEVERRRFTQAETNVVPLRKPPQKRERRAMAQPIGLGRCAMTKPAELYACLYAKEFPAQALLRLRPEMRDRACVVMEGEPPLQTVCSLTRKARSLGMAHGMTQVEVDTFPDVTVLLRSLSEESAAKAALLECAGGILAAC